MGTEARFPPTSIPPWLRYVCRVWKKVKRTLVGFGKSGEKDNERVLLGRERLCLQAPDAWRRVCVRTSGADLWWLVIDGGRVVGGIALSMFRTDTTICASRVTGCTSFVDGKSNNPIEDRDVTYWHYTMVERYEDVVAVKVLCNPPRLRTSMISRRCIFLAKACRRFLRGTHASSGANSIVSLPTSLWNCRGCVCTTRLALAGRVRRLEFACLAYDNGWQAGLAAVVSLRYRGLPPTGGSCRRATLTLPLAGRAGRAKEGGGRGVGVGTGTIEEATKLL